MSDTPKWTPARFWKDKWIEYLIGGWDDPTAHKQLWSRCGAEHPLKYAEQIEANRCLIVTSPKLYEALADLSTTVLADWDDVREKALAAGAVLAKARGETQ